MKINKINYSVSQYYPDGSTYYRAEFKPYGETWQEVRKESGHGIIDDSGQTVPIHQFTGVERDFETNLDYH